MKPQLAALARKHGDKVVVLLVDANRNGQMAMQAGVRGIPDSRLFLGGRQLEKVVGAAPLPHFESLVQKHAGSLAPVPKAAGSKSSQPATSNDGSIVPMEKDWMPPGVTPVQ